LSREWRVAHEALDGVSLPEGVIGLAHDITTDWAGDAVIWVWATVADEALTSDRSSRLALTSLLNQRIEKALRDRGITEPFSLGVRAASEMPEVIGSHAD
jgi:hypothetical protein